MRPGLTPELFRAAGVYLNGGRVRGWRKRVALLLDTPETTIAAWASRSPSNARSIPGTAAVAIKLLVAMLQQREITERNLRFAADVITAQVQTLLRVADFVPRQTTSVAADSRVPAQTVVESEAVHPIASPDAGSAVKRSLRSPS